MKKAIKVNKEEVIRVRVTPEEKEKAEALANEIGINVSQLVRIILRSSRLKIDPSLSFSNVINDANQRLKNKSSQGKAVAR